MKSAFFSLFLMAASVAASAASSGEIIALDAEVIDRFDIGFAGVRETGIDDGTPVPGRVMTSPDVAAVVYSRYDGIVAAWHVAPGDAVEKAAPVVTLASQSLADDQARWVRTKEAATRAAAALERDRALHEAGIIATRRLEQTASADREARAELAAMTARLAAAGLATEQLDGLVDGGTAPGRYTLVAPAAGTLAHRSVVVGASVEAGERLASLADVARLWVEAEVPERLERGLAPGQVITLEATGDRATVRRVDSELDPVSQTRGVHAELERETGVLPGAIVTLLLPGGVEGVHVPADAVVRTGEKTLVYVRHPRGVEARAVRLVPNGADYLATGGLTAGEEVVIQGTAVVKGIQLGLGSEDA